MQVKENIGYCTGSKIIKLLVCQTINNYAWYQIIKEKGILTKTFSPLSIQNKYSIATCTYACCIFPARRGWYSTSSRTERDMLAVVYIKPQWQWQEESTNHFGLGAKKLKVFIKIWSLVLKLLKPTGYWSVLFYGQLYEWLSIRIYVQNTEWNVKCCCASKY